jgi:hypothetical protein
MDTRQSLPGARSVRLAAAAGGVFFALFLGFAQLTQGSPSATASAQEIFDYVAGHDDRLQLAAALMGVAMSAVLVWLSGLHRALTRAEDGASSITSVALGGGVLAAAGTVTGALVLGATASRIADIGAGGAAMGWTMFLLSIGATLLGLLLVIGVTSAVSLQRHLFARWFGWAGVLLALLSLAGAVTIGFNAAGIQVVAGVAVVLDSVWILLVSIFLWRDPSLALPSPTARRRSESLGTIPVGDGEGVRSDVLMSGRHRG